MKYGILFFAGLLASGLFAGDWDGFSSETGKNKRDVVLRCGSVRKGSIRDFQKSGLVEVSEKDGILHVNAARFIQAHPGKSLDFYYYLKARPGKTVRLEAELAGKEGACAELYFEGRAGKHFWTKKNVLLKSQMSLFQFEAALPANLKDVAFRITFRDIPELKIGRIACGVKEDSIQVDGSVNHITNGGAERGLYNVYPPSEVRIARPAMKVAVDGGVFHSGGHSFRLEPVRGGFNRLVFNAVPYVVGKPIVFSMCLKAEKPDTPVNIGLFTAHGSAYHKEVRAGTEWKKYELSIPAFGGDAPGVQKFGNPAMTEGFAHVSPIVTPRGLVWLDDASCQLAEKRTEVSAPEINLSGRLDTPHGYLYEGAPFRGSIRADSRTLRTCRLSWDLRNWRGISIKTGVLSENMTLPAERNFSVEPPVGALGPMNLTVTAETGDGKRFEHTFYTGILRSPGKSSKRWGTNVHTAPADYRFAARLFRDFGLGAVRLWAKPAAPDRGGFNAAKTFHDAGFTVMMNISGLQPGAAMHVSRDSRAIIQNYFKEAILRNRGNVDLYELFNEPEIWAGRSPNPNPDKYLVSTPESCAAATVQMAAEIRKLDPKVKIAGPGCHIKPDFLDAWLKAGAAKALDFLTEHPYRPLPELPDLETAQTDFQNVLKKYRPDLPVLSSESGHMNFPTLPDNRIHPLAVQNAAKDLRYALIEFACGVKTYYHFQAAGIDIGYAWTSLLGDPEHHWAPAPYLYAVRNAVDLLGESPVAGRLRLGVNKRCYLYDTGKTRIAVLWQWSGASETLEFSQTVEFRDMMGNSFSSDKIKLDGNPVYLISGLSVEKLKGFLASARQTGIEKPVEHGVELCDERSFFLRLDNITPQTLTGFAECAGQKQTFKIYGEKSIRLTFKSPNPISMVPQDLPVKLHVDGFRDTTHLLRVNGISVPKAAGKIRIDGDLSDWPVSAKTILDHRNSVRLFPWTDAEERNRAEIRFTWDSSALYLAVTVFKNGFHPEPNYGKMAAWRGDSIQVGIDTMKNASAEIKGLQSDDFEYLFAEFRGKPLVWRFAASSPVWDSFGKTTGEVNDVNLAIRHFPGKTVYEIAFSPVSVSPFRLVRDSSCRLTVLVNLSDGKKRIGWFQLSPGLGKMPHRPGMFLNFSLKD